MSTAVDKVEVEEDKTDNWEDNDANYELPVPTHTLDNNDDDKVSTDIDATELEDMEEAVLESTTIDRLRRSTRNQIPRRLTKVNFDNKSYSNGQYKDGTIHITVDSGLNTDHPSPINPDPIMNVQGTAMLHYTDPEAQAVEFAQSYSFKVGLKRIS